MAFLSPSTVLSEMLEKGEPQNIYSADKTRIYYGALSGGTITLATEKLSGSRKARITLLHWSQSTCPGLSRASSPEHWEEQKLKLFQGSYQLTTS